MPFTNAWVGGAMILNGSTPVKLKAMTNAGTDWGIGMNSHRGSGTPDPSFMAAHELAPKTIATLMEIGTALNTGIWLNGLDVKPSGGTYTSVDLWFTKTDRTTVRAIGSNHFKVRHNSALIVPRTLSCAQGQDATLTVEVFPWYDGTNACSVITNNAAFPAGLLATSETLAFPNLYTKGPVKINGTEMDGNTGWTLDFGMDVKVERDCGETYPTIVRIMKRDPVITLDAHDFSTIGTWGDSGIDFTDIEVWLRRKANYGANKPNSDALHIKIFGTEGALVPSGPKANGSDSFANFTVAARLSNDGTNPILQFSLDQAIT